MPCRETRPPPGGFYYKGKKKTPTTHYSELFPCRYSLQPFHLQGSCLVFCYELVEVTEAGDSLFLKKNALDII